MKKRAMIPALLMAALMMTASAPVTAFAEDVMVSTSSFYVLPQSDSRYIRDADLDILCESDIRIARNEIYARHGYIFKDETLNIYFSNQGWYRGTTKSTSGIKLNQYESKNLETIIAYEKKYGLNQEKASSKNNTFVFPTSGTDLISESSLYGLSEYKIRIARNEIFARHGYIFKDQTLRDYFENQSWYEGTVRNEDDINLNKVEERNVNTILRYERQNGLNSSGISDDYTKTNIYILPNSDWKYVTEAELDRLSEEEIKIARNEIYARHGLIFKSSMLKEHFGNQKWYEGTVKNEDSIKLNKYERANVSFICTYEEQYGLNQ